MEGQTNSNPIIYIGGATRSGSTLLEMILGNVPGFFSVGEVRYLWEHLQQGNVQCGCGALLAQCPFWSSVLNRLQQEVDLDFDRFADLSRQIDRTRNLFWLDGALYPFGKADFEAYVQLTQRLYKAIQQEVGDQVVIDSSKVPSHIYLLNAAADFDVRLLHLVRDARAVAYSWNKRRKRELAVTGKKEWMPKRSMYTAVAAWALEQRFMLKLGARAVHYTLLRYEDYTERPYVQIHQALIQLGFADADLSFIKQNAMDLMPNHSVNGNPIRFQQGKITINPDQEWRREMPRHTQYALGLPLLPLLSRFGYQV